jgi:hypothetical protein
LVAASKYNLRYGGYTPIPWSSNKTYAADSACKSFIFSLTDSIQLHISDSRYATFNYNEYGPTFGAGHDFRVADNANMNFNSWVNPFNSYKNNGIS